jgi:hypothetical protein
MEDKGRQVTKIRLSYLSGRLECEPTTKALEECLTKMRQGLRRGLPHGRNALGNHFEKGRLR